MYNLKTYLRIDKADAVSKLNESTDGKLFLHKFISIPIQSFEDSNAILLRIKVSFFSSRPLNSEEYALVTNSLISLGHKNFIYSWYAKDLGKPDMVIFDAFSDNLGSLKKIINDIKELPLNLKILLTRVSRSP